MGSIALPSGSLDARTFRYSDLRSLHHTLEAQVVAQLEEASLCCFLRDFEPAQEIFDTFPVDLCCHPVIAYQHAQVYWLQWLQYKGAEILEKALAAEGKFESVFRDSGVYTLLRICYGLVKYYAEGNFAPARDAMREVRGWLLYVPIEEYTDVQVNP